MPKSISEWRSRKAITTQKKQGWKIKIDDLVPTQREHQVGYFLKSRPLNDPNLTKYMKACIRCKQHTNSTPKQKQLEAQQKYRFGTISNIN